MSAVHDRVFESTHTEEQGNSCIVGETVQMSSE